MVVTHAPARQSPAAPKACRTARVEPYSNSPADQNQQSTDGLDLPSTQQLRRQAAKRRSWVQLEAAFHCTATVLSQFGLSGSFQTTGSGGHSIGTHHINLAVARIELQDDPWQQAETKAEQTSSSHRIWHTGVLQHGIACINSTAPSTLVVPTLLTSQWAAEQCHQITRHQTRQPANKAPGGFDCQRWDRHATGRHSGTPQKHPAPTLRTVLAGTASLKGNQHHGRRIPAHGYSESIQMTTQQEHRYMGTAGSLKQQAFRGGRQDWVLHHMTRTNTRTTSQERSAQNILSMQIHTSLVERAVLLLCNKGHPPTQSLMLLTQQMMATFILAAYPSDATVPPNSEILPATVGSEHAHTC